MRQEMKITVCFGPTKIIVPCGDQLPVRELIKQAVVRYKKVTNKHTDDNIRVYCLQTCDEGAILDEDDTVGDVLDDKDKVIASYEENLVSRPGYNGGDGTSTSSVGTASPDIFQGEMHGHCPVEGIPVPNTVYSESQYPKRTEEYNNKLPSSMVTYVSSFSPRGSLTNTNNTMTNHVEDVRQSKARGILEGRSSGSDIECYEGITDDNCSDHNNDDEEGNEVSAFKRESARKSLKSDHLDRWIDLQESYSEYKRHEPTGAPPSPDDKYSVSEPRLARQISLALSEPDDAEHLDIVLKPTMGENLGITVQGYKTADERELGLIVFEIDPKGCAARDGRVQVADRIVTVNSQDLTNISNERAEEAFSKAIQCDTIELGISRSHSFIPERQAIRKTSITSCKSESEAGGMKEEEKNTLSPLPNFSTPTYGEALLPRNKTNDIIPRIVEKEIFIELQKGSDGLGFSITTRDNPAGGNCPIYVKNILPHGAAVRDGRLQAGDQIMKVDEIEMSGKSQDQAVTVLRSSKGQVNLQIRRKVTVTSPVGAKKLIKDIERAPSDSRGNKILTYLIPLPSSGTAGLGITVKGKSSAAEENESGDDLGIFIKTVVPGGAVQQDGRLRPDDQLISINGVKLTGMSNSSAMKTLRSAMEAKTLFGSVEVTVIRSVKEIMNNVSELETINKRKNSVDRAIDVGRNEDDSSSKDERNDVINGATCDTNDKETSRRRKAKNKDDEITEIKSRRKPTLNDDVTAHKSQRKPILDDDVTELKSQRKLVFGDEMKEHKSNDKPALRDKPVLRDEITELKLNRKPVLDDELTELKSSRKPLKPGNGVHRNHSYYIAMNRNGKKGEKPAKLSKPLAKFPFYQPQEESGSISEQIVEIARPLNDEKPKIVIASYTDAARVSTSTRAFCISSRPTSTVGETTAALSTTSSTRLLRSSEAKVEKSRDMTSPKRQSDETRSKHPPTSLQILKGTPPPPPPRTSRPSPYAKHIPNYLPANALPVQKSNSAFSNYSATSEVSAFKTPRGSTSEVKILSATEVKTENKNEGKSNAMVAKETKVSKQDDNADHVETVTDDEDTQEPFLREGFGRQSMSEKRFKLAQADITQTEFYKQRVTRSKSLEGTQQFNVNQLGNNCESITLPRPSTTPIDNVQQQKAKQDYNERLIDFSIPSKESSKDSRQFKDISAGSSFDQGHLRGQWRTSSDGVVKKYGRHGGYVKASPLASTKNNNVETIGSHSDALMDSVEEAIPITMQSNADYNSVHPKVKKKQSPFNLKVLGAALKPKAYKGKYDMQCRQAPDSPNEPRIDFPDEQRYRQLVLGERRARSSSETLATEIFPGSDNGDNRSGARSGTRSRRKAEQGKRSSPSSLQDFLKKGSGEYSISASAQI